MAHHAARGSRAAAQSAAPPVSALEVAVRRREGATVLEVSAATGGALGHFDPASGRLHVVDGQHSLAVAAAVGPYLFGTISRSASGRPGTWQPPTACGRSSKRARSPGNASFRCATGCCSSTARSCASHWRSSTTARSTEEVASAALAPLGITLAVVSLRDLEHHPAAVAGGLNTLCTRLADSRPGAKLDADQSRSIWSRRKRR